MPSIGREFLGGRARTGAHRTEIRLPRERTLSPIVSDVHVKGQS